MTAVHASGGPDTERLLRKILDESREGVAAGDLAGQIRLFNRAAEEVCGRSAADVIGKLSFEDLCPPGVWPDLRRRFFSARFGGPGRLAPTQTEILSGGGDRIPVDLSACAIGSPERPEWIVIFLRDLRLQVKLEERLAHAQAQLEQGNRPVLLAELAGTAAHELNQPLTSIMGYADLLRRQHSDGSNDAAALDIIVREAERMADIVRKIGRVNRYETKSYIGESRIVDLDRAVDQEKPGGR
ncbi:MAG: histidine kinase dimerization/phospho-acceptor domain-containing protein [Myxococcales bacterium]